MSKQIIRFTASWCGPCKMLSMAFLDVATDIPIEVIDIDQDQNLAVQYQVRSVPTVVMVEDGKEISRFVGARSAEQIQQWIDIA